MSLGRVEQRTGVGGGSTRRNALRLSLMGMPVVTLPKTIEEGLGRELAALQIEYRATDRPGRELFKTRSAEPSSGRLSTIEIAGQLSERTGLESRVTILGHVQRGGTPSPIDRILATHLGTASTA